MPVSVKSSVSKSRSLRRHRVVPVVGLVLAGLLVAPGSAFAASGLPTVQQPADDPTEPTSEPTTDPTTDPTAEPTSPTSEPTESTEPSEQPSDAPTETPSQTPTQRPAAPSRTPDATTTPTPSPTQSPEQRPTSIVVKVKAWNASNQLVPVSAVNDGTPVRVVFRVTDGQTNPRPGWVTVQYNDGAGWFTAKTVRLVGGNGHVALMPLKNTQYKVHYSAQLPYPAAYSGAARLYVRPFVSPVSLPSGAPRPSVTPPAATRATNTAASGAYAQVLSISDKYWATMVGRSWRSGCPVGRNSLRVVLVTYIGFDGLRYRGELVVNQDVANRAAQAFTALYNARIPIRSMTRVDVFGYSSRLGGADDYKSMAADNTSAFNCRGVVGRPSARSPHSYGRSIDINPWENPYHSAQGVVPNTWWVSRSHPQVAWRSRSHQVVQIMARYGFRWTYGTSDAHHFDG
ncbi:M15 family metallopeptidase [Nocardioides zeae]|uniref:M15 family metallopeptidase n=1 Tax=Nocardioides imazamoxiresistens TaxID=3231893 RepID=A0ABU3PQN7_9ACTN|nr:M15 family metallopeptidase [Nocardioides zeae]MDT9591543.1 M15 family metallopeptidase [Nocardioides zeae]